MRPETVALVAMVTATESLCSGRRVGLPTDVRVGLAAGPGHVTVSRPFQ